MKNNDFKLDAERVKQEMNESFPIEKSVGTQIASLADNERKRQQADAKNRAVRRKFIAVSAASLAVVSLVSSLIPSLLRANEQAPGMAGVNKHVPTEKSDANGILAEAPLEKEDIDPQTSEMIVTTPLENVGIQTNEMIVTTPFENIGIQTDEMSVIPPVLDDEGTNDFGDELTQITPPEDIPIQDDNEVLTYINGDPYNFASGSRLLEMIAAEVGIYKGDEPIIKIGISLVNEEDAGTVVMTAVDIDRESLNEVARLPFSAESEADGMYYATYDLPKITDGCIRCYVIQVGSGERERTYSLIDTADRVQTAE